MAFVAISYASGNSGVSPFPAYPVRVTTRSSVVDYALQRRALLADVHSGRTGLFEVCDAHPYLLRAAKYHGQETDQPCPVCRREKLTHVHYVYGDELGHTSGQAKRASELESMAARFAEFTVYVVEVCRSCAWNYLAVSFVLGQEEPGQDEPRRRKAARE